MLCSSLHRKRKSQMSATLIDVGTSELKIDDAYPCIAIVPNQNVSPCTDYLHWPTRCAFPCMGCAHWLSCPNIHVTSNAPGSVRRRVGVQRAEQHGVSSRERLQRVGPCRGCRQSSEHSTVHIEENKLSCASHRTTREYPPFNAFCSLDLTEP